MMSASLISSLRIRPPFCREYNREKAYAQLFMSLCIVYCKLNSKQKRQTGSPLSASLRRIRTRWLAATCSNSYNPGCSVINRLACSISAGRPERHCCGNGIINSITVEGLHCGADAGCGPDRNACDRIAIDRCAVHVNRGERIVLSNHILCSGQGNCAPKPARDAVHRGNACVSLDRNVSRNGNRCQDPQNNNNNDQF